MREIIVRGVDAVSGKWVYGGLVNTEQGAYVVDKSLKPIPVLSETVGLSTNLKDQNGQYIFEGDILRFRETKWGDWLYANVVWLGDENSPSLDLSTRTSPHSNSIQDIINTMAEVEVYGQVAS